MTAKATIADLLGQYEHHTQRGNMKPMGHLVPQLVRALVAYIDEKTAAPGDAEVEAAMGQIGLLGTALDTSALLAQIGAGEPAETCEPCAPGGEVFKTLPQIATDDIAFFEKKYEAAKKRHGKGSEQALKLAAQLTALKGEPAAAAPKKAKKKG